MEVLRKGRLDPARFQLCRESFLLNKKTGATVFLKRKGASYVVDVEFVDPTFQGHGEIPVRVLYP